VEKNAAGTTQAAYVSQGPSIYDPLIYMDRSGTKSYHLFNHLGTTLALASSAQALSDTYRRNAWGVDLASTGSTTNPFGFVGRLGYYRQPDISDYWVRVRVYRPQIARWLSRDPVKEGIELYSYVGNRPLVVVDPTGLEPICGPWKTDTSPRMTSRFFKVTTERLWKPVGVDWYEHFCACRWTKQVWSVGWYYKRRYEVRTCCEGDRTWKQYQTVYMGTGHQELEHLPSIGSSRDRITPGTISHAPLQGDYCKCDPPGGSKFVD